MKTSGPVAIAFDDVGDGEPALLFLPGRCSNRTTFRSLLAPAARHRRALALDWLDHGGSVRTAADFGWEDLISDAAAVIGAAGLRSVVPWRSRTPDGWRSSCGVASAPRSSRRWCCWTGWCSVRHSPSSMRSPDCRTRTAGRTYAPACLPCGRPGSTSRRSRRTSARWLPTASTCGRGRAGDRRRVRGTPDAPCRARRARLGVPHPARLRAATR